MNVLIAIGAALAVWAAVALFGPVTIWRDNTGRNARNWPGLIIMDRRAPLPAAVWAQEFYESRRKIRRPWERLARIIGRGADASRDLELMGHEIEVQSASLLYKTKQFEHRRREAQALAGYKQFRSWTPDAIEDALQKRSAVARKFVDRHMDRIAKFRGHAK